MSQQIVSEPIIEDDPREFFDKLASTSGVSSFLYGQAICLALAFLYHRFLAHTNTNSDFRHLVAMIIGLCIGFMTFGRDFFHVLLQSGLCYSAILFLPTQIVSMIILLVAMGYLLCIHFNRACGIQTGMHSLDISGPLMIATQKITCLGFSITDGSLQNTDKISQLRKKHIVMKAPTPLEYFSYILYFQGLLAGPFSFYSDYIRYIEGTTKHIQDGEKETVVDRDKQRYHPIPFKNVGLKLAHVLFWMVFHICFRPSFDFQLNVDTEFVRTHGILYKTWFHVISMLCQRSKYYVAFILGDAICNMSGFGFSGYDAQGNKKWDMLTNVNVLKVEFATNPKDMVDNWNIQTTIWLRHVCFDRCPRQARFATFVLSAIWHGLYPGYYFTFVIGGIFYSGVRQLRKKIRPFFLHPPFLKKCYDVLTWILTQVALSYVTGAFILLQLKPTLIFYNSLYWWLHIAMTTVCIVFPFLPTPKITAQPTKTGPT